jgi:Zn-dependent M28 family amino/carboxypeptidase
MTESLFQYHLKTQIQESPLQKLCTFPTPLVSNKSFKKQLSYFSHSNNFFPMKKTLLAALVLSLSACVLPDNNDKKVDDEGLASFSKDSLARHIIMLASDSFQGRRPFTVGETFTVDYLAKSFAALGLEPSNNGSYFQDVPLVEITPKVAPSIKVQSAKASFDLKAMEDYVIWTEDLDSSVVLDKSDVVFAGFGVVAPEYNWNDYEGLDVKGKTVLVMVNDPIGDSSLFKGKAMTYYGRWTYKFEEAARQGAKACLIVHNTERASYPFSVVQNSWGTAQMHLDTRGGTNYRCPVEGWITEAAAKKLLAAAGDTSLLAKAQNQGFKAVSLGLQISTSMQVGMVFNKSKNVIAQITGSKYPDEYIIYTAHWDHFGIGKPDAKGDSIYNGALDNASGTAALLEMARVYKSLKTPPERTIIFLAVTGEEQGLLGSAYYGEHPVYPLEKTVANINMDVLNNFGKTKDLVVVGAGQSDLEDYLTEAASAKGRYISPEPHPGAGSYFRSDHFNFAKHGVPALTTESGIDDVTRGKEFGEKQQQDYTDNFYHQPSDEYLPSWNLEGSIDDIQLLFMVGKKLAYSHIWPKWKEGSEFKSLRK